MLKALTFLIITGFSWVVVGAVVGLIERRNYRLLFYQIVGPASGIVASVILGKATGAGVLPQVPVPARTWWIILTCCIVSGIFNYTMFMAMGRAMKKGPNAVVWAIIQSGLVYPFIMGWLVFGETMNIYRGTGILLIIASVFLYSASGRSSDNAAATPRQPLRVWVVPALIGMLYCGINQCCSSLPSFVDGGQNFPSAFRVITVNLGMLLSAVVTFIMKYPLKGVRVNFKPGEVKTILLCVLFGVIIGNTVSVLVAYPGIDMIENLGRGSMAYPVMVCSCIIGFFPYGIFVLREKFNLIQAIGVITGTAGIILGCLFK